MVSGTAVTVQTNSGVSPFHIFGRCRPMAERVRCFHDPFIVVSSPSRLCFASRWPSLPHALSRHIPCSTVIVSHDVVLMLQAFISRLHTSLKRSIGRHVGL